MSKFLELDPPTLDYYSKQWIVRIKPIMPILYLVSGRTDVQKLESFLDYAWDHFAFESEQEAMDAAHTYYTEHGEVYPYTMTVTVGTMGKTIESQIMRFK